MSGLFITFEGIDFCGKTTQARRLVSYLRRKGYRLLMVREPGGDRIGESIRGILLSKTSSQMTPLTELLLYEAARAQLDDRLADLAHRREKFERQRTEHARTVDEDALKLYEQVLSKHTDGAMVLVVEGRCASCNINLTPQSYNMVLIGEKPQKCRSCGRICYSEDSPGRG